MTRKRVDICFPQPGENIEYKVHITNLVFKEEDSCIGDPVFCGSSNTIADSAGSVPSGSSSIAD
jgi:hypothetical protein